MENARPGTGERGMKSLALALVAIVIFAWGCEDRRSSDAIEQAAAKARSAEPVSARPTTQELMSGPKKRIPLTPLPFTANVPMQWKIESLAGGGVVVLTGATPTGDAQIQLTTR